jgi:hypothetical protein
MNKNEQIQPNYILDEFIRVFGVPKATEINYQDITAEHISRIKTVVAPFIQQLRNKVNAKFQAENGKEIGIRSVCCFRSKRWDISQNRSGLSEHTKANGDDLLPINCKDDNMYLKVFYFIASELAQHNGGFAIKFPTFENGKIKTFGFIHIDFRGTFARWNY